MLLTLLTPLMLGAVSQVIGCTPKIGDKCQLSTDCSTRQDRLCDTSQPGGYCTQFNCSKNSCPDDAVCVLFNAAAPGCGYEDRSGAYGSRFARSFCVSKCSASDECRSGYVCADPSRSEWNGFIQDDDKSSMACLVPPSDFDADGGAQGTKPNDDGGPPVCAAVARDVPPIEAGAPRIWSDSGADDGGADGGDGGPSNDAGDPDAGDASDGG